MAAKNAGKKLVDWATGPAMRGLFVTHKINFVLAHTTVKIEPNLAEVVNGAKMFPSTKFSRANRKPIADRCAEVLPWRHIPLARRHKCRLKRREGKERGWRCGAGNAVEKRCNDC